MKYFALLPVMALLAAPAVAQDLTGEDGIMAAIAGNTVEGGMSDGAAYSEFYGTDGAIKADGYTGTWSVVADEMCFDYGEGATCFGLQIDGTQVTWFLDGAQAGTGTVVEGNPNGY